jgi:hypothetical protein
MINISVGLADPVPPLRGRFFERPFTELRCTAVWLELYLWSMEATTVAIVCVDLPDFSSEEESTISARNLSSIYHISICVVRNCGSMAAYNNSAENMSKKSTGAIDRTSCERRGRAAWKRQSLSPQTGDRCAPEPTPTEILFSGARMTEQMACTAGCGGAAAGGLEVVASL